MPENTIDDVNFKMHLAESCDRLLTKCEKSFFGGGCNDAYQICLLTLLSEQENPSIV